MNKQTKKLKSESKLLQPAFNIGKNGINDEVIKNIKNRLEKDRLVKIKMLPAYVQGNDKKKTALELAEKCNAQLIDLVGFTIVLGKK